MKQFYILMAFAFSGSNLVAQVFKSTPVTFSVSTDWLVDNNGLFIQKGKKKDKPLKSEVGITLFQKTGIGSPLPANDFHFKRYFSAIQDKKGEPFFGDGVAYIIKDKDGTHYYCQLELPVLGRCRINVMEPVGDSLYTVREPTVDSNNKELVGFFYNLYLQSKEKRN